MTAARRIGPALLLLAAPALLWLAAPLAAGPTAGAAAPAEPLDQNGVAQPWQGSADAYTVIDFAASWCAPCWKTLPKLAAFAADHPDLEVIVVSVDDDEAGRQRLVRELGLTLPVLWDGAYRIAETYSPEVLPATVVLAPGGTEIHRHLGSDWAELERYLRTLVR